MQQHPSGAHLITWIVPQSVAYACDKLVLGDEILQVNYITVVRPSPSRSPKPLDCVHSFTALYIRVEYF